MNFVIREAVCADFEQICAIEQGVFSDAWSAQSFRYTFENPSFRIFVADVNGTVAGYVVGGYIAPESELGNIATAPEYRRHGIARALMEKYFETGAEQGCDTYFLEVRQSNIAARTLYENFGFAAIGKRKNYYSNPREDAVVMKCERAITPERS